MAFRFVIACLATFVVSNVSGGCIPACAPPAPPCAYAPLPPSYAPAPFLPCAPPPLAAPLPAPLPSALPGPCGQVMYVLAPAPALPALPKLPVIKKPKYPKFESETSHLLPLNVPSSIPVGQFCSVQKVAMQPNLTPAAPESIEDCGCAPAPAPLPCAAPLPLPAPLPCAAPLPAPAYLPAPLPNPCACA